MSQKLVYRAKRIKKIGDQTMFEIRGGSHYLLPTDQVQFENHNRSVYGYLTIHASLAAAKKITLPVQPPADEEVA